MVLFMARLDDTVIGSVLFIPLVSHTFRRRISMHSAISRLTLLLFFTVMTLLPPSLLGATTFTDPVFGWQLHLPGEWKVEVQKEDDGSISGKPGRGWILQKNPMTYVGFQVEEHDIRNSIRFEEFREKSFEAISATMLYTAQKAGAQRTSKREQVVVDSQVFDSLLWVLQAPNRPALKSMTLVAPMADKAVMIGISCTEDTCGEVFDAIDSSRFTNPDGKGPVTPAPPLLPPPPMAGLPVWDFTIPIGWKRVAPESVEEKLAITDDRENNLSYVLIEDEDQELASMTIMDLKSELFKETVTQFREIADENALLFNSGEDIITLGKQPFQNITINLLDPDSKKPAMTAVQYIAIVNGRLAMIMFTCLDEQCYNDLRQAVEASSFR